MSTPPTDLAAALDLLARHVARHVVAEFRAGEAGWIAQRASTAGSRRHIEIVRRRIREGRGGAIVVGRDYLLSPEAYQEELQALSKKLKQSRTDELAEELGLRLVGGGR